MADSDEDSEEEEENSDEDEAAEDCREEREALHEYQVRKHRDRIASKINYGWQQGLANRFSRYLKQHDVLEQLQPALPLLYEMPVKPKDLYEFLGEFLDNGAQTLLKISLLQAELRLKQTQVQDLKSNPDYIDWKHKLDAYIQEQSQLPLARRSIAPYRPSIADSVLVSSPISNGSGDSANFTQTEYVAPFAPGLFPARTSFAVQAPRPPAEIDRLSIEPYDEYTPSHMPRPSLLLPLERDSVFSPNSDRDYASAVPNLHGNEFLTLEDVKAMPFRERLSIFADAEESGISIVCNPSVTMLRIDAAYQAEEDRLGLEEAVGFIEDHKKVDPFGVLFDFDPKHCAKDYVVDLAARPSELADIEIAQVSKKKRKVDPMKGTDYEEEDEGSNFSEPEYAKTKPDPLADIALLKDGFHVMAEMQRFETEALMEQSRVARIYSDDSSDEDLANAVDMSENKDNEALLRQYTELDGRNPNKRNRYLRVLKAPKIRLSDCVEWSGNQIKKDLQRISKQLPRMIKGLKYANADKPTPLTIEGHKLDLLRAMQETNKEDNLLNERKKNATVEATRYAYALKCETLHVLLHLKSHLVEVLAKERERKHKEKQKARIDCKNFGYTKFKIDEATQTKEKLQKLIGQFSHAHLDKNQQEAKKRGRRAGKAQDEDTHTHADHEDPGDCAHHSHKKFGRQRGRERSRKKYGRSSSRTQGRASSRSARRAKKQAPPLAPTKLKTTPDFLFEIPLDEVKNIQKWIDSTFPESVFRLNEPFPEPKADEAFDDDEDENYAWLDDFNEIPRPNVPKKPFDDNLTIPRQAMDRIHAYKNLDLQQIPGKPYETAQQLAKAKRACLKVISEDKFARPIPVPSIPSMLKLPSKQLYRQKELIRPSEKAKQYVIDTFAQPFQSDILRSFNFSLLDPDLK